jgi:hypothetical protein
MPQTNNNTTRAATSDCAADLGHTCQASVRLKEKLAEMEAAKATAEARAPERTP